jgi:uncharacterized protein YbaP (TraB family)
MRIVNRVFTAVVLALVLAGGAAAQTRGHSFLWKVQSGANVMYLAGSVHALTADAYPLNPVYQRAFDASSVLVEEIDLAEADPLTGGLGLLAKGMYTDGRTFNGVVSRETAALVAEKLKGTPLALELIQPMKPWMVTLMLEALGAQSAGLDPELGLDKHFYNLATDGRKQVIGLETVEYQIDRFDKMPDAMQEQLLRSELAEMETEKTSLRTLLHGVAERRCRGDRENAPDVVHRQPGGLQLSDHRTEPQLDAAARRVSETLNALLCDCRCSAHRRPAGIAGAAPAAGLSNRAAVASPVWGFGICQNPALGLQSRSGYDLSRGFGRFQCTSHAGFHPSRRTVPSRRGVGRTRNQLRRFFRGRRRRRSMPVRRRWSRNADSFAGAYGVLLARVPLWHRSGAALRFSRAWAVESGRGAALQSGEAVDRSICEVD